MTKEEYRFWLANIPDIGNKKIDMLLRYFGSEEKIFTATVPELEEFKEKCYSHGVRFSHNNIKSICESRSPEKIHETYAKIKKDGIYFVSKEDDEYPPKLREIYDAPYGLYYRGKLPKKDEKVIAIIGARECSVYGKEMALYFAGVLAKEGVSIISGLARGIDTYAHEGTLRSMGTTYGILGCGIDICYPRENIRLFTEMQQRGGIISEYSPGVKPFAGNFPMRNRIISGLSDGILVIEAKEKSGSLITVDYGLEQGKEIYALPGKITDQLSGGCNNLIKMGAKLVTHPKDILEDLYPGYRENLPNFKNNYNFLELEEKMVYASLCLDPKHIEEIALQTGLGMDVLMEHLLNLELRGFIKQTMKNYYIAQDPPQI